VVCPFVPSPELFQVLGSSSRALYCFLEFVSTWLAKRADTLAPSLRFVPLSRYQYKKSTNEKHPKHSLGSSSVFRALSTICSFLYLASFFHPATTSEVLSSGVFPVVQSIRLCDGRYPLGVGQFLLQAFCCDKRSVLHCAKYADFIFRVLPQTTIRYVYHRV